MKTLQVLGLAILLSVALPVMANGDGPRGNCNGAGDDCNDITIGGGDGGDADAAAHARASASAHAGALALGYVKGGDQYVSVYNRLYTSFRLSQQQSQLGIVANVGPQVEIGGDTIIYEQKHQAPSMVAPGIDTSQVNVDCPLFVQDGWSGSLSGPGAGASAGATDAEAIPTCFALLAANNSTGATQALAQISFYCLSFEAAGVDNKECDGWRDVVRGGPAPTVRSPEVREGR